MNPGPLLLLNRRIGPGRWRTTKMQVLFLTVFAPGLHKLFSTCFPHAVSASVSLRNSQAS